MWAISTAKPAIRAVTMVDREPIVDGREFIGAFERYYTYELGHSRFCYSEVKCRLPDGCRALVSGTPFVLTYENAHTVESSTDGIEHRIDLPATGHPRLVDGSSVYLVAKYPVAGMEELGGLSWIFARLCWCRYRYLLDHGKGPETFPVYAEFSTACSAARSA